VPAMHAWTMVVRASKRRLRQATIE
jgi:hypothetical protein